MIAEPAYSRLPAILLGFPASALELSPSGVVLESNGRLEKLVGRTVVGLPFDEVLDATSQAKWARLLASRNTTSESTIWELVLRTADAYELRSFAAIWGREHDVDSLWLLEYARDVRLESQFEEFASANSALLQTQRELARERARLTRALAAEEVAREAACAARAVAEAAVRIRDEVLAIVAHDLRSPLDRIVASTPMLYEPLSPENRDKLVAVIARTAKGMNRLISDLLDAASIEAGHLAIDLQTVDVAMLVDQSVEVVAPLASSKGVSLSVRVAANVPSILADAGRVQQTLSNLLGNAVRLTQSGGAITVRVNVEDTWVHFAVSDTGPGIPADQLPHLFERFWQAKLNRRGAAGLGLAIAKGIVEAHGGRIWVESELGIGSTFHLTLPTSFHE
jgi:signal transduction histidine kinase